MRDILRHYMAEMTVGETTAVAAMGVARVVVGVTAAEATVADAAVAMVDTVVVKAAAKAVVLVPC